MRQPLAHQQAVGSRLWHWLGTAKLGAVQRRNGRIRPLGGFVWLMALAAGLMQGTPPARAEDPVPSESQVKAAFLVSFPKYVDWPSADLAETNSPITVAFFGGDNVADEFRKMVEGKTVNGHPVVLKRVSTGEESAGGCQIAFIGASERQRLPAILGKLKGASILTVGESDDFLGQGGIINLARRDRKIRLEVNLSAASQARLKISSKLLSVADMVKGKSK